LQYHNKVINRYLCELTFELLWFTRSIRHHYSNERHRESFHTLYDQLTHSELSSMFPSLRNPTEKNQTSQQQSPTNETIDSINSFNTHIPEEIKPETIKNVSLWHSIDNQSFETSTETHPQESKSVQTELCNDANASNNASPSPVISVIYHSNHLTTNAVINASSIPNSHNTIYNFTFQAPLPSSPSQSTSDHHHPISSSNMSSQTTLHHTALHNADNTSSTTGTSPTTNTLYKPVDEEIAPVASMKAAASFHHEEGLNPLTLLSLMIPN